MGKYMNRNLVREIVFSSLANIRIFSRQKGCLLFHGFGGNGFAQSNLDIAFEIIKQLNSNTQIEYTLSFDDAYSDIEPFLERCSELSLSSKVFVPTGLLGTNYGHGKVASNRTLRRWLNLGNVYLGSHGHTHINLTRLDKNALVNEINISKKIVEEIAQKDCLEIAYPRGKYNDLILNEVKNSGYTTGWTTERGLISNNAKSLAFPRIPIHNFTTPKAVVGEFTRLGNAMNLVFQRLK